ncbi:hypothetical protein Ddye_024345 [Dipteronia dyeriana]|uniref:Seipin n=1 Tax=Dipteronia dyeriana TaxID=168575 RepID=A0AAD9TV54_9ROSI|nr:hypothetical protein Ddye_024345 [Dipteronia dyeriana]
MDPPNPTNYDDDEFFDAFDDFPIYDCISSDDQSHPSTSDANEIPSSTLRRRSLSRRRTEVNDSKTSFGERSYKTYRKLIENELDLERKSESSADRVDSARPEIVVENEESTVTTENDVRVGDSVESVDSPVESLESSSLLVYLAGLVIKAVSFQFNLIISFVLFPIRVLFFSYMIIVDPFRTIQRGREFLLLKLYNLCKFVCGFVSPLVSGWLKEHESVWKLVFRIGWGLFWAIYVGFILCGLLVFSILISGLFMRYLVEEPIQIKETLNFDYKENSPVALIPLTSCYGASCGVKCEENKESWLSSEPRVIPIGHKLQVTVILTLPESEYNRNLGVFQVRVDFLSVNGKPLSSSSRPCMLRFKSEPIRLLLTFLRAAPLVAGYISETQTLKVKLRGFMEGNVPTSCLKVKIEQRAEFWLGAGIPQIYDASLILESELPLFKRIIWYWRKTIFIWITMTFFTTQLSFMLICCRPVILPKARPRHGSARNTAIQASLS